MFAKLLASPTDPSSTIQLRLSGVELCFPSPGSPGIYQRLCLTAETCSENHSFSMKTPSQDELSDTDLESKLPRRLMQEDCKLKVYLGSRVSQSRPDWGDAVSKVTDKVGCWGHSSVAECLPTMSEALGSSPSTGQ